MHDAMSHTTQFVEALQDATLGVEQHLQDLVGGHLVVGQRDLGDRLLLTRGTIGHRRALDADAVGLSVAQRREKIGLLIDGVELELDGGGARVEHKNFHGAKEPYLCSCS